MSLSWYYLQLKAPTTTEQFIIENMAECNDLLVNFPSRNSLIEHWPKPVPSSLKCSSADDAPTCSSSIKKSHQVRFSESSRLHTYQRAPISLLRSLTYTKDDRDAFGRDAFLEGIRIKNLITDAPLDSASESIKFLVEEKIVSRHEFIGIDHFILGKPTRVHKIRKHHAAAVLWKQQEQQEQKLEDPVIYLGKFAEKSSLKSTQNAQVRAAMAA